MTSIWRRAIGSVITRAATSAGTPFTASVRDASSHPISGKRMRVASTLAAVRKSVRSIMAASYGSRRELLLSPRRLYTVQMYSIVKRLRERGRRLHNREISALPGVRGEMVVAICGYAPEAKIYEPNDQQRRPLIPELQNVQLLTMTATGMLLYGTECAQDGAEYVQEWSVRILQE